MSVKYQDYYQTLGVPRTATQEEIQRAYRKLARQYHPDVNKEPGAEDRFKQVGEAYAVLKDPETRQRYDQLGANWKAGQEFRPPPGWAGGGARSPRAGKGRAAAGEGGFSFDDIGGFSEFFETIFGSRAGGRSPFGGFGGVGGAGGAGGMGAEEAAARRGAPGAGTRQGESHEAPVTISLEDAYRGGSRRFSMEVQETDALGRTSTTTKTYDVRIPPGTTEGSVIRLAGQGAPGRAGGAAGDLLLRISIAPHPRFRVDGHDLLTTLALTPSEAALGTKAPVQTLDGKLIVTIPPGSQSGQKLRLRGKGLPKRGGEHGDLLAELRVMVPKDLSEQERELYKKLSEVSAFNPRSE